MNNPKIQKFKRPADLIAGIDNLSLRITNFVPSRDEIERICQFFSIGKLLYYEMEKGIIVAHSSHLVYVATTRGHYALKFYPLKRAKTIAIGYATNLILVNHHFPTPVMHTGTNSQPYLTINDLLVTCHSYIDGFPLWQLIRQQNTIHQINAAMLSLKNILSTTRGRIPFRKQKNLKETINDLTKESQHTAPYVPKKMIDATLLDACRTYQHHQSLFIRRWIHNNITLTNVLIDKGGLYVLDLEHVIEDYALSDLTNLVISCLFFGIPVTTIKTIVKDYFAQHKIGPEYSPALNTLAKIELIKEYQKYSQRERTVDLVLFPPDLAGPYISHLSKRIKSIIAILEKLNDKPNFLFN